MKIVTIIENLNSEKCVGQHGLCIYIEHKGKKYLLDGGPSGKIIGNAKQLGIDLSKVDIGILSHAHFDHSVGYKDFFEINKTAKIYLQETAKEPYYGKVGPFKAYVGIPRNMLLNHKDRFVYVNSKYSLGEGVWLIPHYHKVPKEIPAKQHLYRYTKDGLKVDDLLHEQSLAFETDKGLVLLNSCMHAGVELIIKEVEDCFPDKNIYSVIGGFHLMGIGGIHTRRMSKSKISNIGKNLAKKDIQYFYTGHCTGLPAYRILKREMSNKLAYLKIGLCIDI